MPEERVELSQEIDRLSDELASRWLLSLERKNWTERLALISEIHEQLKEDLADIELYCALSPVFVRKIIEGLAQETVADAAQAQIYANSESDAHRRLALAWLRSSGQSKQQL